MVNAYHAIDEPNHIDSIPGIGDVTAAVLTAFILDINRFESPTKLTAYFGVMPIEISSGVDRDGKARAAKRYVMCRRGNDLVRRYLWMAALSAVRFNPAVRALYARVVAKNPDRKAIAIGHAMRKLLHLVFAVWKTKKPFDKTHYRWDTRPMWSRRLELTSVPARAATGNRGPHAYGRAGTERGHRGLCRQFSTRSGVEPGRVPRLRARQEATADDACLRAPGHRRTFEGSGAAEALRVSDPSRRRTRPHVQRQRA